MTDPTPTSGPPTFEAPGSLQLFGHDSQPATVSIFERARGWRIRRAALFLGLGIVLAPVVAIFPPHVAWLLGALGLGGFMAWRTMTARFAVAALNGSCPRCGAPLQVPYGVRLRDPHPVNCAACQHELVLRVPAEALARSR